MRLEALEPRQLLFADSHAGESFCGSLESYPFVFESTQAVVGTSTASALAAVTAPGYSSLPGASASLFLDFDGHFEFSWGGYSNVTTPAFDLDGNTASFSSAEASAIFEVWSRVAEDFSPFNINVTTIDPGTVANRVVAVIAIGGSNSDWYGSSAGGVAYVGGFYNSSPNVGYVFENNLSGNAKYIAEASAHEAGHLFGLQHQAVWNGSTLVTSYNQGNSAWAPLMGVGYYAQRTTWHNGPTSAGPTAYQDDMAILAGTNNAFGYRPDDFGSTLQTALSLANIDGNVNVSGLIGRSDDVDVWSFVTIGGDLSFQVSGAAIGANLDAVLEIKDSFGVAIAIGSPTNSLNASISATVSAGLYYVAVHGMGDYGDVGQYTLTGTIVPSQNSVASPSNLQATLQSQTLAHLQWTDNATNDTGYVVESSVNGSSWTVIANLPANSTGYDDGTLAAGSTYSYRVRAVSGSLFSDYSNVTSVTTIPAVPSNLTATAISASRIDLSWTDVAGETSYRIERSLDGVVWTQIGTSAQNNTSYQDVAGLNAATTYYYRVAAVNSSGDSDHSSPASAQTLAAVTLPAAPSNLTASRVGAKSAQLTWTDNSSNEAGFVIERKMGNGGFTVVATLGANVTSFMDTLAAQNKTYTYRIRAFNDGGNSDYSNLAAITSPKGSLVAQSPHLASAAVPSASLLPQDSIGFWDSLLLELQTNGNGANGKRTPQ